MALERGLLLTESTVRMRPLAGVPGPATALALLLGSIVARSGVVVRDGDEGAIAHIWQLLMAGQLPLLANFVIRWLPRVPRQTLFVLALQICAALAALAPVYFLAL
jgi:hypothetical protein